MPWFCKHFLMKRKLPTSLCHVLMLVCMYFLSFQSWLMAIQVQRISWGNGTLQMMKFMISVVIQLDWNMNTMVRIWNANLLYKNYLTGDLFLKILETRTFANLSNYSNSYCIVLLDTYLYKGNAVSSQSGRLELISENLTYDIQMPSDTVRSGKYDWVKNGTQFETNACYEYDENLLKIFAL